LSLLVDIINKIMNKGEGEAWPSYDLPPLSISPEPSPPLTTPDATTAEGIGPARFVAGNDRQEIDRHIQEAAARHGVEADLVRAVIEVESRFDPRAVSPAGARGTMQLMPATAADLGVHDPFDPGQNISGGTRYLRQLLDRYGGNRRLALAAYNWGMGNLERKPEALPRETRQYLQKVEKAYERYSGASRARGAGWA
jgi:soluble lytic murein transglycosylase-like protein